MIIGQDFPKLEWSFMDYIILEPNALVTDTIMALVSLYLAYLLYKKHLNTNFSNRWLNFFIVFGISSFLGGLGHALFYYFGAMGKMPNWITGIVAIYMIEYAMSAEIVSDDFRKKYEKFIFWKMILVFAIFFWVVSTQAIDEKPEIGFLPVAIHTIIGVFYSAGILGYKLSKTKNEAFIYFYWGVLIILPSAFFFLLKINPTNWFDKNDISHLCITAGIIFFYNGVVKVETSNVKKKKLVT
jgi:hypothetical protein